MSDAPSAAPVETVTATPLPRRSPASGRTPVHSGNLLAAMLIGAGLALMISDMSRRPRLDANPF